MECYSPTTDQAHEDDQRPRYNDAKGIYIYDAPDSSAYDDSTTTGTQPHRPSAPPAQGVEETESLLRGESPAALIELIRWTEGAERRVRRSDKFKYLSSDDDALHVRFGTTTTVYGRGEEGTAGYDDSCVFSPAEEGHRRDAVAGWEAYDDDVDGQEFEDWKGGGYGCECECGGRDEENEELEEERDEAEEGN
ncbi:hypothetical protein CSAL01_11730 [Colletotrichum salicis]|uniref:Uncharacterized protein n=1 Tax=Colletotrichum salicis TaxID=1209931 RepID=A0A135THM7_9PEZI|nr:hypothetical protein CSAL01_11730 [Colletotrichum salicis]